MLLALVITVSFGIASFSCAPVSWEISKWQKSLGSTK